MAQFIMHWRGRSVAKAALASIVALLTGTVVAAAPAVREKVLFENQHIRFIEVTRWPGAPIAEMAEPYPAIVAVDAAWPALADRALDEKASATEQYGNRGLPPGKRIYPWCQTHSPLTPHAITITGNFPQHFYLFEYKRVDGDGFSANWKSWYPWMLSTPASRTDLGMSAQTGAPYSEEWPFPMIYNAVTAAPANHFVRYEDEHIQLVEVVVRPHETENMHGHPYRSVYANDGAGPTDPVPPNQVNKTLVPAAGPPWGGPDGKGMAPRGSDYPDCLAAAPEAPHQVYNPTEIPEHFYRLQFKRIDGDDIKSQWHRWYPRPVQGTP
jgi:hypothetical protein